MNRYDERRPRFWRHERDPNEQYRDPGQDRPGGEWRGRDWGRESQGGDRWSSRYGQREPYNARGGSRRSRWGGPWSDEGRGYGAGRDDGSRYSESQYGAGRRRASFDPYGERYEPQFGEGPFADTSESPSYFGTGNYGDGGASPTGGYDQRARSRNPGSLGEDTFTREYAQEQRRYRTGPKGYTRSDERIREDICERLMLADSVDSSEVTVTVRDGRVALEGTVPTRSMKHAIEDVADYTAGVQDVENRIRVERAGRSSTEVSSTGVQTASGITPTSGSKTTKQ